MASLAPLCLSSEHLESWFSLSCFCCSVAKLCPTLCKPMDFGTPGIPVLHYLLEFAYTHVLWVDGAIQPSHSLSPNSPPTLNLFPASGSFPVSRLFALGAQSIATSASASVLPTNIQGWFPLGLTDWSPCSPRDSQESYPEPQFESINSLALSLLYGPTLTSIHISPSVVSDNRL